MQLRAWRKEHDKSQRESAAELSVHRVTLCRYELGIVMPPGSFIEACRQYTGGAVQANDWQEAWEAHRAPASAEPAKVAA